MKPVIALDADGVLVDLHLGYASAWHGAFGHYPLERDPQAYWPIDRWQVDRLDDERRRLLREQFDERFWTQLPAIAGAVQACHELHDAGHELVCVTALEARFAQARLINLRALGFPIERVIATGHSEGERSPKADAIAELRPVAFVDDYLVYMRGIARGVHTALVLRAPNGSPNTGPELELVSSTHPDLADFAQRWLAGNIHQNLPP